ncbi:hypothetical protein BGP77_06970 [Saccharospirillum sp. MSK14-1]|uniref:hypothetical protein n=1 Tax=Saccharospirillum sp. MSK14-1 TaxID=1897632 RepID=UPI000D37246A|nr:hypothetical protein [Saccharospirillum sp. MSK14-1]PTY37019.1 hypothetical protein BGP77_06970 [Saccharospirillum sp. MSK14-1]
MMNKWLCIITTLMFLAGCNSEDGGKPLLSFDVSGHWQVSIDTGDEFEPLQTIVVDPEGRFMGTDGENTLVGRDADSLKLDGKGVSGSGVVCNEDGDEPLGFSCNEVSFNLVIEDDDHLVGSATFVVEPTSISVDVKLERLKELDVDIDDPELYGSWESVNGTGTTLQVNSDLTFTAEHANGDGAEGQYSKESANIYSVEGAASYDGTEVAITGLGFFDADGQLTIGVSAELDGNVFATGDLYQSIKFE